MRKLVFAGAATLPLVAAATPTVPADVATMIADGGAALVAIAALGITVRNYRLVFKLIGKVFGWVFGRG